jgi:hypothetical protein
MMIWGRSWIAGFAVDGGDAAEEHAADEGGEGRATSGDAVFCESMTRLPRIEDLLVLNGYSNGRIGSNGRGGRCGEGRSWPEG